LRPLHVPAIARSQDIDVVDDLGCGFVRDCLDRLVVGAQSPRAPPNFVKFNSGLLNLSRRAGAPESTLAGDRLNAPMGHTPKARRCNRTQGIQPRKRRH
jgi:hypothetical protein